MKGIIILFVLLFLTWCGVTAILGGDIDLGMDFLFLPIVLLCGALSSIIFEKLYEQPQQKRQEALRKRYFLPQFATNNDYGVWETKFQKVIAQALEETSDSTKNSDLKHCQRVVEEMNKGLCGQRTTYYSPFSKINDSFRITGCHLTITDSEGNIITKIV